MNIQLELFHPNFYKIPMSQLKLFFSETKIFCYNVTKIAVKLNNLLSSHNKMILICCK